MLQKLIATRGLTYAGKWRPAGEPFEAARKDARVLIAIRSATAAPADEEPQAPAVHPDDEPVQSDPAPEVGTKDMTADDGAPEPGPQTTVGAVTTGRRKYQRREDAPQAPADRPATGCRGKPGADRRRRRMVRPDRRRRLDSRRVAGE